MCGIVGILGPTTPATTARVKAMISSIAHRGPNGQNYTSFPEASLGHSRLSILDLDDRARQPMFNASGQYVIVFNGEIYNYKELRKELDKEYFFRTTSDTEVLLAAWSKWGEDCLQKLIGMFAFCIYDIKARSAFLARDRFGQKPLFFTEHNGYLLFASEIKAILSAGYQARPNIATWARYLVHTSFDDDENTFFEGIYQLKPGELATYQHNGSFRRKVYYQVADHIHPAPSSLFTSTENVRELMVDSVRIHMRSDVPVGISLSGGLDSSAILSCLALGSGLPENLLCFSMEYGEDLSERPWIDAIANSFGLKSQYTTFTRQKLLSSLSQVMWHQEAPIGGLPNCALAELAQLASRNHVTVLQDGTGLDEIFGGYQNHHGLYLALLLESCSPEAQDALEAYAKNWDVTPQEAIIAAQNERRHNGSAIDGTQPQRHDLLTQNTRQIASDLKKPRNFLSDPIKSAFIDYLQARKIPRNLRMKDRATMAFGRELRLPFLDHRLVEYGLSLPNKYYFFKGRSKSIVRNAFIGRMDNNVRLAPKRSIQAPQAAWISSEPMKSYIENILSSESFADRGLVNPKLARTAYREFCENGAKNSLFIWQWINIEEWFRIFIDGETINRFEPPHSDPTPLHELVY